MSESRNSVKNSLDAELGVSVKSCSPSEIDAFLNFAEQLEQRRAQKWRNRVAAVRRREEILTRPRKSSRRAYRRIKEKA